MDVGVDRRAQARQPVVIGNEILLLMRKPVNVRNIPSGLESAPP
jgi:hypothetical protein